jgi:hypothetical protein
LTPEQEERLVSSLEEICKGLTSLVTLEAKRLEIEHPTPKEARPIEVAVAKYKRDIPEQAPEDAKEPPKWSYPVIGPREAALQEKERKRRDMSQARDKTGRRGKRP